MSEQYFDRVEHTVPGQHIRHYAKGTSYSQEDELALCVKQYRPRYGSPPLPGDITIIASHASGFPKELYEPVWNELFHYTQSPGTFRIRNIWIADVANQGYSGVLNEHKIGTEPSYFDHARDLLLMVNHFRREMPRPLVGIGHSMGGCVIINLALLHPRLLTTVIAIEPIINQSPLEMSFKGAYPLTFKPDLWASRSDAEGAIRKSPFYQNWDQEVLELYLQHSLRDTPTAIYPSKPGVTLTTSKHQEAFIYGRAVYPPPGTPLSDFQPTHRDYPDLDFKQRNLNNAFYNPSATQTFTQLPFLKPSCYYIYGEKTQMVSSLKGRADKRAVTGMGVGGSGGAEAERVQDHVIEGGSHFCPFENPKEIGRLAGLWLQAEWDRWSINETKEAKLLESVPLAERSMMDKNWLWWMKESFGRKKNATRNQKAKL